MPDEIAFATKPQIALDQIDRALSNGVQVSAWTFDEFYSRDSKFLNGLESRRQVFVGEIPHNFHGWLRRPSVLQNGPHNTGKSGRPPKSVGSRNRTETTLTG